MSTTLPSIRALACGLMIETQRVARADTAVLVLVNANLRRALRQFTGATAYAALVSRALLLATATMPALRGVSVRADGEMETSEPVFREDAGLWRESAILVTTRLLESLIAFLGEPLTRRIVREACPDAALVESVHAEAAHARAN